jgi:hypothetical protein
MKSLPKCALLIMVCATLAFSQDFGIRYGLGASALRDHKALMSLSFGPNAIRLFPAFSAGAGLALSFEVNEFFSIAPELQYTLYQAKGELTLETGTDFDDLYEAGVILHSLELPILARFSFGSVYLEAGPQIGRNIYARVYMNNELKKPKVNAFAFGPSLGGGVKLNKSVLFGLRGHFGLLEYAKNTNGYPWALHMGASKFL